jgi:hypothetical protein
VFVTYLVITALTIAAVSYAAYLNFTAHPMVIEVAERTQTSPALMRPFGAIFIAAAVGLAAGFKIPVIGTAAATGLVLYFICAVLAHMRVRDYRGIPNAAMFLALAAATLTVTIAYHGLS